MCMSPETEDFGADDSLLCGGDPVNADVFQALGVRRYAKVKSVHQNIRIRR